MDFADIVSEMNDGWRQDGTDPYGESSGAAAIIRCSNGTFIGMERDGIEEYRGIPFALPPVGSLRWKAPAPAPDRKGFYQAFRNGKSPIQTECKSERASYYKQGEDCLYLNLWMGSPSVYGSKRPVMVFLHGGAFGWGGTADPLYDGSRFAAAHPDVVLITAAYRVGLTGFVDLSYLPGGEEFPDAPNLGILDQIEALRWIRKNAESFGADPENITIFGESAGGASVSLLPLIPQARGLFRRVIAESGSVGLTYSKEQCKDFTDRLIQASGAKSMKDLLALSEDELKELNRSINEYNNFPQRDGKLIPLDPFVSYWRGETKEIDMLIGTNADEANYWIGEVGGLIPFRFSIPVKFENDVIPMEWKDRRRVREFLRRGSGHSIFRMSAFYTEMMFRLPAILQAGEHAENGGTAYLYYWTVPSKIPHYGACHAVELAYVFGNTQDTVFTGEPVSEELSKMVQQMWVNFARCGDPSLPDLKWPRYNKRSRKTMVISETPHVERDPRGDIRKLLYPLMKYHINPSYKNLNLNTHFVRLMGGLVLLLTAGAAAGIALLVSLIRKKK